MLLDYYNRIFKLFLEVDFYVMYSLIFIYFLMRFFVNV